MTILSDAHWRLIERAYCNTTETIAAIAARHEISPATISYRRMKFGWPPRRAGAITRQTKAPENESPLDDAALVARFYALINLKLAQMEEDMARPAERTPTDHEREARSIGTLVRSYEKVSVVKRESVDDDKQNDKRPERRAEAEAIRRQLAEQIVRLRKAEPGNAA